MIDEKELNQWWHSLSIKRQDSYKRLINDSTQITMSIENIKLAYEFYLEELRLASNEFFNKYCDEHDKTTPSEETMFIAGCKFILNNKNQW